jgi:hypothetical protein
VKCSFAKESKKKRFIFNASSTRNPDNGIKLTKRLSYAGIVRFQHQARRREAGNH